MTDSNSKPLPPPDGYASWLDYAISTMETRGLFLEHCGGEMAAWKDYGYGDVQRSDMRAAAAEELSRLRTLAADAITMAEHGDYHNGVEQFGSDEGQLAAWEDLAELHDRARVLGVQFGETLDENQESNNGTDQTQEPER